MARREGQVLQEIRAVLSDFQSQPDGITIVSL